MAKKEYIDVEQLFKCETCYHMGYDGKCNSYCDAVESYRPAFSKLKTADVVEVKHGKWIEKVGRAKCSVCADECWADSAMEYRYCPNCGAKMDGGKHG